MRSRRNHDEGGRTNEAPEVLKGESTATEMPTELCVRLSVIMQLKKSLLRRDADLFEYGGKKSLEVDLEKVRMLYAKLRELAVANDLKHGSLSHQRADKA